ncbi:PAS domain S-box protein [Fictibacillus iocasae]|uniref:histidine kinase n=1 Tax=Fictibacillus iocasae TaxID=2715437 RepID=A0ABW2NM88_9BACL
MDQSNIMSAPFIQQFIQSLSDAVILLGGDQKILNVNEAAELLIGSQSSQLEGQAVNLFIKNYHPGAEEVYVCNKDGEFLSTCSEGELPFGGATVRYLILKPVRMQKQDDLLKALMNIVPDFIGIKDDEGRFVFANAFVGEMFGVPDFDFTGKHDRELAEMITPFRDVFNYCVETDEYVWQKGRIMRVEERIPSLTGGERVFDVYKIPVFQEDGSRKNLLVFGREVTEKIESEARYRLLAENVHDIISTHTPDGAFKYISPSCEENLGLKPEDLIGKTGFGIMHPDDIEKMMQALDDINAGVRALTVQFRLLNREDDGYVWLEASFKSVIDPITGEVTEITGVTRNISERKNTEKLLVESKQRYKSLFDHNPSIVCSMNRQGQFTRVNRKTREISGYSMNELLQMTIEGLLSEGEADRLKEDFREVLQGNPRTFETFITCKSGDVRNLRVTGIPIVVEQEIIGVYGVARDVTELKKTEEMLRKSDKLSIVGQLAASIAHEIRNPLTSLKGFIQLFLENRDVDAGRYYLIMHDELSRIEHIMSELLLLAKPQVKSYKSTEVKSLVSFVSTLLERHALVQNIHIITDVEDDLPFVLGEENELKQVLINLIKNGIEAMSDGGVVLVKAFKEDDQVKVQVIDQGCGIPKDRIDRLGEPFFTTKEKGTGLGMMVSYKIMKEHNGDISIESTLGKGTIITLSFPVHTN